MHEFIESSVATICTGQSLILQDLPTKGTRKLHLCFFQPFAYSFHLTFFQGEKKSSMKTPHPALPSTAGLQNFFWSLQAASATHEASSRACRVKLLSLYGTRTGTCDLFYLLSTAWLPCCVGDLPTSRREVRRLIPIALLIFLTSGGCFCLCYWISRSCSLAAAIFYAVTKSGLLFS